MPKRKRDPFLVTHDELVGRGLFLVINLRRRVDRQRQMRKLLRPMKSISWEFMAAIDGKQLSWDHVAEHLHPKALKEALWAEKKGVPTICRRSGSFSPHLTLSAVGCALSPRAAWAKLAAAPAHVEWALILEDDVCRVAFDFEEKLDTLVGTLPSSWRFCYLGYHESSGAMLRNGQRVRFAEVGIDETQTGLYGYLIRRAAAEGLLLKQKVVFPLRHQIDVALGHVSWPIGSRFILYPDAVMLDSPRSEDGACDTDVQTLGSEDKKAHGGLAGQKMLVL